MTRTLFLIVTFSIPLFLLNAAVGQEENLQNIVQQIRELRREVEELKMKLGKESNKSDDVSRPAPKGVAKLALQDPKQVGILDEPAENEDALLGVGWIYRFGVKTGTGRHSSGDYAGTDCDVQVKVVATGGDSQWMNLDRDGDDFESGDHRFYTFRPSTQASGTIKQIHVRFRDRINRHNPRWQLSYITFEDWNDGVWTPGWKPNVYVFDNMSNDNGWIIPVGTDWHVYEIDLSSQR